MVKRFRCVLSLSKGRTASKGAHCRVRQSQKEDDLWLSSLRGTSEENVRINVSMEVVFMRCNKMEDNKASGHV